MFDELSGEGWLIVVLALVLGFVIVRWGISIIEDKSKGIPTSPGRQSNQRKHERDEDFNSHQQTKESTRQESPQSDATAQAWHEVLGVTPAASIEEIRVAYKRKMSQYHPDKVASLGEEFMDVAVNKSKDINSAYQQAMAIKSGRSESPAV